MLKAVGAMIVVQVVYAGVNILYKLAISDGMNPKVMTAYRFIFGAAFLVPVAFFAERKSRPPLTWMVLWEGFCSGLVGGTLVQNLYISAIAMTSAIFVSTITNLIPAITLILAVSFRLEKLAFRTKSGQVKVLGLLMGIGGTMILTLYKGIEINLWSTKVNLLGPNHASTHTNSNQNVLGSLLSIASCTSYSVWLIIQAKMSQRYPCHYSSTALMCVMASIQSVVFSLAMDHHNWSDWKLGWNVRLLTVIYSGAMSSALAIWLLVWCIKQQGPLFGSIFNPLMPVIVAILGSFMLDEKLYLGSILGAVLIIIGLYMVLWGKYTEIGKVQELSNVPGAAPETSEHDNEDLEVSSSKDFGSEDRESKKEESIPPLALENLARLRSI